jgi:hypothetical protein
VALAAGLETQLHQISHRLLCRFIGQVVVVKDLSLAQVLQIRVRAALEILKRRGRPSARPLDSPRKAA